MVSSHKVLQNDESFCDAMHHRCRFIRYRLRFTKNPTKEYERQADPTIKFKFEQDEWKDALFHLLIDTYHKMESNESDFGGATMYIFNPYSDSSYTFIINQSFFRYDGTSGGTVGHEGYKQISVLKTTDRIEGIKFYNNTGNFANFGCNIYGLRVDS